METNTKKYELTDETKVLNENDRTITLHRIRALRNLDGVATGSLVLAYEVVQKSVIQRTCLIRLL